MSELKTIIDLLRGSENIYITSHVNPDGDAVGSCLALGMALENEGKKAAVVVESFGKKYSIIPGRHLLFIESDNIKQLPEFADPTFISLDCADISRLSGFSGDLFGKAKETISIDHHYSNTNFSKYNYVDSRASSTCEMVYRLLEGYTDITIPIASALYAGMVSDTGGFRFNSTSRETLSIAAKLTSIGIPFTDIYTELMLQRSYKEVKFLGRVIEATRRSKDGRIIYVAVTSDMMKFEGDNTGPQDMGGIAEFMLNTDGAEISVLVYDKGSNNEHKVSLRSNKVNIGEIAKKIGGGGHKLAAGATLKGDINNIINEVLELAEQALNA